VTIETAPSVAPVSPKLLTPISPAGLAWIARSFTDQPGSWQSHVRFAAEKRWYIRLAHSDVHEVWLLTWLPGQQTGFHDHGDSAGAFVIATGCLNERVTSAGRPETTGISLRAGAVRSFGPYYIHDVSNDAIDPAVSIHAYSPPLSSMRRFEVTDGGRLRTAAVERSW
jgi:predicted metal-dependent enzyme (double-stranded beta helix superfamily)